MLRPLTSTPTALPLAALLLVFSFGTPAHAADRAPPCGSRAPRAGPASPACAHPLPRVIGPHRAPEVHATGSLWNDHAFSRNIWTEGPLPRVHRMGGPGARPAAGKAERAPPAVERWVKSSDCLVIGDSIAVGLAEARPQCSAVARSGISSGAFSQELLTRAHARTVVISLGVNDDDKADTVANLRKVRAAVKGRRVVWLLPGIKERARSAIRTVARQFGDRLVDTRADAGRDRLHPTGAGYQNIADKLRLGGHG